MKNKIPLFFILFIIFSNPLFSKSPSLDLIPGFMTGNQLKRLIDSANMFKNYPNLSSQEDMFNTFIIQGYVKGITDALSNRYIICPPQGVLSSQIQAITLKHLEANPEYWNLSGAWLMEEALKKAFPCKTL